MTKISDLEFAHLNGIELQKVKELEDVINRQMRVNNGREIYLMAFSPKDKEENESGEMLDETEPTYNL